MALKSKLAAYIGSIMLASAVFAAEDVCPSIDEIKGEGISMAESISDDLFLTYQLSNYNTDASWGFLIAPVQGADEDDAIGAANEILDSMSAPGVPFEEAGMLICSYETGVPNIFAAAVRDDFTVTPNKLKSYFKKAH